MNELSLARDLAIIATLALIGGSLARKFKLPLIIGYLFAGLLFNSFIGQKYIAINNISGIANIGVALLLFSLGLEFSFKRLSRLKNLIVSGTLLQILLTIILALIFSPLFHLSIYEAVFFGAACSLSSTAIVVKILAEKGALETQSGEISVNWLLIQDLAVLPLTLILPTLYAFTGHTFLSSLTGLLKNLLETALIIYLILILGKKILPKILEKIGGLNSRELLVLGAVSLSVLSSFVFLKLGLSFALGAFVAGILISTSFQNHAVFVEIRPIRDLFSMVFFVLLGMMVDMSFIFSHFGTIIGLTALVIIGKYSIVFILMKLLKYHSKISSEVAINLVQVGEFAFVLSAMALGQNLISTYLNSLIISVALITIAITPFLMDHWQKIARKPQYFLKKYFPPLHQKLYTNQEMEPSFTKDELPLSRHVVICGYGRVGRHVGDILLAYGIPFIVIDMNQKIVKELKERGIPVVYGDPTEYGVLDYAQVDKAGVVIIAIPDRLSQEQIIKNSLDLNKNITIICRSHVDEDRSSLLKKGANVIIQPEFEASLSIAHKVLEQYQVPKENIITSLKSLREYHEK